MKETINIYNYFHNGDIFYSRMIIQGLIKNFKINYYHNLLSPLFLDIPEVNEFVGIPTDFEKNLSFDIKNKKINTWIGQNGFKYLNRVNNGCTYENHLSLAKDVLDNFGVEINNIEDYLPEIYHENIPNIENITNKMIELKTIFRKIVLISNGNIHSGQSDNFDFTPTIERLSNEHNDVLFLLCSQTHLSKDNVLHTNSITNFSPDLLHIGYLSKYCDIIIGRASGPYCFAQNKENLLNPEKTFIAFCHNLGEGKFYQNLKSKFVWSNNYYIDSIYSTIKNEIK
jgi:hypothetical protein